MIEHRNSRYEREQFHEAGLLAEARPDELFDLMDGQGYIDTHRFPKYGPIDFNITANHVGITMIDMPEGNYAKGTYFYRNNTIAVSTNQRIGEQHISFTHEMGHVFAKEKLGGCDGEIDLENFCDYFAYKMLFNGVDFEKLDIRDTKQIIEIAAQVNTDVLAVLMAWLALTDSGNILVTSQVGRHFKKYVGEIRTEPVCRCRIIPRLACRETDNPPTVDFSKFEVWGALPTHNHRTSLEKNEPRRITKTNASVLGIDLDDEPF